MNSNKTSAKHADTKVEAKTKNTDARHDARYNWYGVTEEDLANEKIPNSRYNWYGVTPDNDDLSYGALSS